MGRKKTQESRYYICSRLTTAADLLAAAAARIVVLPVYST